MPGNEDPDKVHNFFEQNNSTQHPHSQVVVGSWPLVNSNHWSSIQSQNGMPISSYINSQTVHYSESNRGNSFQSSQFPFGNLNHSASKQDVIAGQPRNQQSISNGSTQDSQTFKSSTNHAELLEDGTVSDRQSQQQLRSQHPGMSQSQPREQAGSNDMQLLQQHLMYKQLQELQRQQQLQQLNQVARQQNSGGQLVGSKQVAVDKLPALLNGTPISNVSNSLRQNEFVGSEAMIASSSQMFDGNWAQRGGPSAMYGFSNGFMFPNEQGQVMRSMGFAPQQPEQSLYGTPVSSTRARLNQYARFQGMPNASSGGMTMEGGIKNSSQRGDVFADHGHTQDGIMVPKQGLRGSGLFVSAPNQNQINGIPTEQFQQIPHQSHSSQVQEIPRQEQSDWLGNLQEKSVVQAGASQGVSSLDPTEEKLLFGTDNDASWVASFGRSGNSSTGEYLHGNSLGDNDCFGALPSVQSGSWSALMLDALDASSSDTGVQEEWSGLSFQKTDTSIGNHSAFLNDNEKQQIWNDNNMQNAPLISKSFPLFNESEASPSCQTAPDFQSSSGRFAYGHNDQVPINAPHESSQQSTKDAEIKQLDQGHQPKQFLEDGFQTHMQPDSSSAGAWVGHIYEQAMSTASAAELKSTNMKGAWAHQQNTSLSNVSSGKSNHKHDGWHMNGPVPSNKSDNSSFGNHRRWHDQKADMNETVHTERDHSSMWKTVSNKGDLTGELEPLESHIGSTKTRAQSPYFSSFPAAMNASSLGRNEEMSQQEFSIHQGNFGRPVPLDSYMKYKEDETAGTIQDQAGCGTQTWDSSLKSVDRRFSETGDDKLPKMVQSEGCSPSPSNSANLIDNRSLERRKLFLSGNAPHHFVRGNQNTIGQSGQKTMGPHKFQYHPMGNVGMNMEPADGPNKTLYPQSLAQHQGLKNVNQGYVGRAQFVSQVASNNAMNTGMGQVTTLQRNSKGQQETLSGTSASYTDATKSTTSQWSQNNRADQTSQNMLELLQKVDPSKENYSVPQFKFSADRMQTEIPHGAAASDGSASHPQYNQSSVYQGFGLRLAPPSQRLAVANHALPHQISLHDLNVQQLDPESVNFEHKLSNPTASAPAQSPLPADETSQRENSDNDSSLSGQTDKVQSRPTSHSPSLGSSSSHHRNPSQHVPQVETKSASSASGMSRQAGYSTVLNKVWKNLSAQRLSGIQPQKFTPNILQSMIPSTSGRDSNLWTPQKGDDQSNKGRTNPEGSGTCSINSQQISHGDVVIENSAPQIPSGRMDAPPEVGNAHYAQDPSARHNSDGDPAVSVSSLVGLHQLDLSRGKHTPNSAQDSQIHVPFQKVASSSHDIGIHGHSPKPSDDVQQQQYSLLHQMQQLRKGVDSDQGKSTGAKFKGADFSSPTSQMDWKAAQLFNFGQNTFRVPADREMGLSSHGSLPSEIKMLNFSSEENHDKSPSSSSQVVSREVPSQDICTSGRHDLPAHSVTLGSKSTFLGGSERPFISPQMAPSWFEQYGNYKNGQILAMYDKQNAAIFASQQHLFSKASASMDINTVLEQRNDMGKMASFVQGMSSSMVDADEVMPSHSLDYDSVLRPKKRKPLTSDLPLHKEVTQGSRRRRSISMAELEWAQVSNRLIEKVEDEFELIEDGPSIPRPRRRIILTTQLMQLLFPPVPTAILTAEAHSCYENLTYFVARSALSDACSSCVDLHSGNMTSGRIHTSEESSEHILLKFMEGAIGRSRKLESDLSRLDKRMSILDLRVECQELERFSIINRLGKFHGRSQADGVESSSTSEAAPRRIYPQRYVTALPMTGNPPEGVLYYSL
ncbi:hypothetical protein J5N97_010237 [Dioscorea zingiberensis]|uniref:Uncharacterized protein n=1 Tax=Dioscorea zingiberensis TaxID=325984 RepID=A0A9D5CZS9_9LILI|nr:hypothetical protein J5N97_010237 [Dioscorea zingiberensis]